MKTNPLISLITVNYNTPADTVEFLESVQKLTYSNIEVMVVDNASTVSPAKLFTEKFPSITFIQSEKNLGFAGGNNLAIAKAKGDYLFFLNSDTVLFPDFLEPIVEFMEAHPTVGMASPKVLFADGKTIQFAGARVISPYTGRGKRIGLMEEDKGQYNTCYPTGLGHGAALIVPKKIIQEVGPMPEEYFLYYEEHDWCELVKRAGYEMYYLGNSKVIHKEAVSMGGESPLKVFYMTRNRLLFMRRNSSWIPFIIGLAFFLCVAVPKQTIVYLLKGKFNLLQSFYKGIGWNIVN